MCEKFAIDVQIHFLITLAMTSQIKNRFPFAFDFIFDFFFFFNLSCNVTKCDWLDLILSST